MSLPILGFATEDAKSAILTTFDHCPFALVNSDQTQNSLNEAHDCLLFSHR